VPTFIHKENSMATDIFDPNEQTRSNNEETQGNRTAQTMKASEADQAARPSTQDRSHTAAVMDTDRA
jgi:hypothetical protein